MSAGKNRKNVHQPKSLVKRSYKKNALDTKIRSRKSNTKLIKTLALIIFWLSPVALSGYLLYEKYDPSILEHTELSQEERSNLLQSLQEEEIHESAYPLIENVEIRNQQEIATDASLEDKTYNLQFFFVHDDKNNHKYQLQSITKAITTQPSKLIPEMMKTLLNGPNSSNESNHMINALPQGTQLLDYQQNQDRLTLNFNETFQYGLGISGMQLQIAQIVLTFTQLEGIRKVHFAIEGQDVDYLDIHGAVPNMDFTKNDIISQLSY